MEKKKNRTLVYFKNNWQLYLMVSLPIFHILLFQYVPMHDIQIAFRKFMPTKNVYEMEWVGLKYFIEFFNDYNFRRIIVNTISISLYSIIVGFPIPIIFALSLNYIRSKYYKKTIQMVAYAPHFISAVVIVGMLYLFLSNRGVFNTFIVNMGGDAFDLFGNPKAFKHLYVWSGIWQTVGFNSIIYISTLVGIPKEQHEAAIVDGATIMQRIIHVDLPGIMPTAVVLLILSTGSILNVGFEKVYLLQNSVNIASSEVISTYVYKVGIMSTIPQYSYGTAIGIFQSFIGFIMVMTVNKMANKINGSGIW